MTRQVLHYNLDMILSVGYRVNSKRGTQFRIWANSVLKQAQQLDQAKSFVNKIPYFSNGLGILDDYDNERLDSTVIMEREAAVIF